MEPGIHELTAGYALDALDPEDRREYEAHLADCPRCREELSTMWQTAEALAVGASGPEPSPELRDRVLAAARSEPQAVVPLAPRRSRAVPVLAAAAAVAAVLALAVGLWAAGLSSDLDASTEALERERAAAAVLADPAARSIALETGDGRLVVDPEGTAVLVLDGVDPVADESTYELWILAADAAPPSRAGLFPGSDDTEIVLVDGVVDPGSRVAVTVEPAGGVDEPTTDPIAVSEPA
jgi:anti-sigma-K factor RskA